MLNQLQSGLQSLAQMAPAHASASIEQLYFIVVSVVVLGILVFVHEFGHFIVAKLFKVAVIEFSIGFGKKIWRRRLGETHYAVGAIPLGGYVRMAGDDPFENERRQKQEARAAALTEELEKEAGAAAAVDERDWLDEKDRALLADEKRWFLNKSFLPKTLIVLAGPLTNLVFGFVLAVFSLYAYGKPVPEDRPIVGEVIPKYPAELAGLRAGDTIKSIDGVPVTSWTQLVQTVRQSAGREMELVYERSPSGAAPEAVSVKVQGIPDTAEMKLLNGPEAHPDAVPYKIGITPSTSRAPVTIGESLTGGTLQIVYVCRLTGRVLRALFIGEVPASQVVGGPLAVFSGAAKSARRGLESLLDFMVLLSVSLAIFNLFPIPILDGGHIAFFVIEKLLGRPINIRVQAIANQVGMFLLLLLMVFALSNDILRLL